MNEFEKIYERIMEEARKARDLYLEWLEIEIDLKTFFHNTEEHAIKTEIMPDITTKLATKFDEQNYDFEIQFLPSMTSIVIRLKIYEIREQLGNELPSIRKLAEASSALGASMTPLLLNTATFY